MVKHANKPRSKKSKRMTSKLKFKIEKKVKQHKRRMKKEAKKLKDSGMIKKKVKDVPIPNSYGYKAEVLEFLKVKKEQQAKEKKLQKQEKKYKKKQQLIDDDDEESISSIIRTYVEYKKDKKKQEEERLEIIKEADILIYVLDSRAPEENRCHEFEQQYFKKYKIIFVLNKIDLIPLETAEKWQRTLGKYYPTVLFSQQNELYTNQLCQLIKKIGQEIGLTKPAISIVGYHNSGKQTLINKLKPRVNGFSIKLINNPAIIFEDNKTESELLQKYNIKINDINNSFDCINTLLKIVDKKQLLITYQIANFNNKDEFLQNVCEAQQFLLVKGKANLEKGARFVLNDFILGKFKIFKEAPKAVKKGMDIEQ